MNFAFKTKMAMRNNPVLFRLLYTSRETPMMKRRVVRPNDAALIEGFPRSANTFASYAFLISQGDDLKFGNHFHSPAQFALARQYGVPALLVIREPVAACLSFVIFDGSMEPREALQRYISFHEPLINRTEHFCVAPFDEVTKNFGKSIARMNTQFGTNFSNFDHDDESEKRVFDRIAADRAKRAEKFGDRYRDPMRATVPTAEKQARKNDLRRAFDEPELAPLVIRARQLFDGLTAGLEQGTRRRNPR